MLALLLIATTIGAARVVGLVAIDYAPVVASTATGLSAILATVAAVSAWRVKRGKHGVDAIRVTQETMLSTIADLRKENRELRDRLGEVETQLLDCRRALNLKMGPTRKRASP